MSLGESKSLVFSKLKHWFKSVKTRKHRKEVETLEQKMSGKTLCEVVGHDWTIWISTIWESNVEEVERHCKRCGKEEKRIEPI